MSKKAAEPGSRLARWLGAPVRALSRACDSYVRRMSACAGRMPTHAAAYGGRGAGLAPGSVHAATFSSRSSRRRGDDDVSELVRAMSQRQEASARGRAAEADSAIPVRSRSVVVGRIDEDAPCEFGADDVVRVGGPPPVRRARSVAVGGAAGLSSASARVARVRGEADVVRG